MTTEETQVCFFVCADRPLPMTSDQDDFTPSAFPRVLAEASIGEGAQRRSAVPISETGLSSFPTLIGFRQASRGHIQNPIQLIPDCLTLPRQSYFAIGAVTVQKTFGHSCRWSPALCYRAGLQPGLTQICREAEGNSCNMRLHSAFDTIG